MDTRLKNSPNASFFSKRPVRGMWWDSCKNHSGPCIRYLCMAHATPSIAAYVTRKITRYQGMGLLAVLLDDLLGDLPPLVGFLRVRIIPDARVGQHLVRQQQRALLLL